MKDFDYAKTRAEKAKTKKKKWWVINTKNYSFYIWAIPLIPFVLLADYIKDRNYKKQEWSEEKAKKVIGHVLPYILEYDPVEDNYWFSDEWSPYAFERKAPFYLRKWAHKFAYEIKDYVFTTYEKEGWIKTVDDEVAWDKWVIFKKEEK